MTIVIHLTKDELNLFRNLLNNAYGNSFQGVALYNVIHSISLDLAETFDKKFKTIIKKSNLFDFKKKIKFSFKYHEAWALKVFLNNEYEIINSACQDWERNVLLKHINNLDQQLK